MTTILVVDDELSIVEMLTEILEDEGYQVVTASNGEEALSILATSQPAAVLSDIMMPVLDGRELCRRVQANAHYKSVPVVLMSAVNKVASLADCRYAALLSKPFDLENVLKTLARVIDTSRQVAQE